MLARVPSVSRTDPNKLGESVKCMKLPTEVLGRPFIASIKEVYLHTASLLTFVDVLVKVNRTFSDRILRFEEQRSRDN